MRRRRDAMVLAVSLVAHLALVIAWISTRETPQFAESATMEVQLERLPPKTLPEPAKAPLPRTARQPPPLELHRPSLIDAPPPPEPQISPEWRVRPENPSGADLSTAPFAGGKPRHAAREAGRPDCKGLSWDRPVDCPPDSAELAASKSEAAKDSKTAGFEDAGRYKRAEKTYHELPGGAGYPGIACAIFHKC